MLKLTDKEPVLILIFLAVVVTSTSDLLADLSHGATVSHLTKEAIIVVISILAVAWLVSGLIQQAKSIRQLEKELTDISRSAVTPKKYILDARRSLGSVINQQFEEWKLTESEADVGRLLLKGLSLKEIASLRQTLEKTVRQQASSIYKKAGVSGRHAFSAWFIEDIL